MRKVITAMALLLLAVSTAGMAMQKNNPESYRYRWTDAHGQQHFSDSLNNQAIENGYDVLNSSGLVVRHVRRHLSAEERKAADAAQAKVDAAHAASARQRAEDMQMLAAYPNERVFHDAQQAEVDEITQSLRTTRVNLHSQEQNLADLLAHVADMKHDGENVPMYLDKRIDLQRAAVTEQRATLAHQKKLRVEAEQRMQQRIQRYRKLKAQNRDQR